MNTKTVIIDYARTSPAVIANRIERTFGCMTAWREIDEDSFELSVFDCANMAELEEVLADYV